MPRLSKALRLMHDLTGATERRTTIALALLVIAVLLLPLGAMAETAVEPMTRPAADEDPTPADDEDDNPDGGVGEAIEQVVPTVPGDGGADGTSDDQAEDGSDEGEDAAPTEAPDEPQEAPSGPREVEAEGDGAQEVVAPPVAPAPEVRQPHADEVASADAAGDDDGEAVAAAGEDVALEPLPPEAYGPQVTPSLGTATAPLTNPMVDFQGSSPLVLAPQVAQDGSPVPGSAGAMSTTSVQPGAMGGVGPVRDVTAATLSIVQPSWYATATALLVLFGAAIYGAVLRRRGRSVPPVLAIPTAVRPGDAATLIARSVRPADVGATSARSIRP